MNCCSSADSKVDDVVVFVVVVDAVVFVMAFCCFSCYRLMLFYL